MLTTEQQNYAYNAYLKTIEYLAKPKSLLYPEFRGNSVVYVFTTETLSGYMKKIKPNGKCVLTVTGSGDQLINLALLGAKKVDNFDINQNACFITQLKLAALQALSYEEFLNFFCLCEDQEPARCGIVFYRKKIGENDLAFDFKTYLKIKPYLDDTSAFFWNLIYEDFQFDGKKLASSPLFFEGVKHMAVTYNEYLKSEDKYYAAQEKIKEVEINFIECNVLDVHKLPGTYDIILFSNIYDYVTDEWYHGISEEEFVKYIEEQVSQRVNDGGVIQVAYQYNYKRKKYTNPGLINKLLGKNYTLSKRLPLDNMKKVVVPTAVREYQKDDNQDCVYFYKNRKVK